MDANFELRPSSHFGATRHGLFAKRPFARGEVVIEGDLEAADGSVGALLTCINDAATLSLPALAAAASPEDVLTRLIPAYEAASAAGANLRDDGGGWTGQHFERPRYVAARDISAGEELLRTYGE
jgi:hypothetical protein